MRTAKLALLDLTLPRMVRVSGVPPGKYRLTASKASYESETREVDVTRDDKMIIDFQLGKGGQGRKERR